MGSTQTMTFKCDQCGIEVSYDNVFVGMIPPGWLQILSSGTMTPTGSTTGVIFDRWECVRDYAQTRVA